MDFISRLNLAVLTAQQEDELPDYLAVRICAVAEQLKNCPHLKTDIIELIEQLSLYDTYGQTGYVGMGVDSFILEGTIARIEAKLLNCVPTTKE